MTKEELRVIYKEKRQKLPYGKIEKYNDLILIHFQKIPFPHISCVHTYLASLRLMEVDTSPLVRYLQFKNPDLKIAVPKIDFHTNTLAHYELAESVQLIQNQFGIEEPEGGSQIDSASIDVVLVPLLAFDKKGYRVGYGKGFYDKFLATCRKDVITVGLSFFEAVDQIDDIQEFDLPLHYCATPDKLYRF